MEQYFCQKVKALVDFTPNDSDLGEKIRDLVYTTEKTRVLAYPQYLVRPNDHAIFVKGLDGRYRHETGINSYCYDSLVVLDFYPATDADIQTIKSS